MYSRITLKYELRSMGIYYYISIIYVNMHAYKLYLKKQNVRNENILVRGTFSRIDIYTQVKRLYN